MRRRRPAPNRSWNLVVLALYAVWMTGGVGLHHHVDDAPPLPGVVCQSSQPTGHFHTGSTAPLHAHHPCALCSVGGPGHALLVVSAARLDPSTTDRLARLSGHSRLLQRVWAVTAPRGPPLA